MWLGLLLKYGVPLAIYILQKTGAMNALQAFGLKAGTHVLQVVEKVKTYQEYPDEAKTIDTNPLT